MGLISDMLPSLGIKCDRRSYEVLLKAQVAARDFYEIEALVEDMAANKIDLSARAAFFCLKGALQVQEFGQALKYFRILKGFWEAQKASESLVPQATMLSLVELACQKKQLAQLLCMFQGLPIPEKVHDAMLEACVESHDIEMAKSIECIARAQRETLSDSTYSLLIKAMARRPASASAIIEEVLKREGSAVSPILAMAIVEFCTGTSNMAIAVRLLQKMKPHQVNVITAFIWFFIGIESYQKACDVYENYMEPVCSHAAGIQSMDANLQQSIIDSAVLCGRTPLAERLVAAPRYESMACLSLIACAGEAVWSCISLVERWNAVISYWVVLVM